MERNLTLLTDLYQLTMMAGYLRRKEKNNKDKKVIFDYFFRKNPFKGGYVISAGLEQVIDYIKNLYFTEGDIEYLKSLEIFSKEDLDNFRNFRFEGDIYSVPEGTPVFPKEPLMRVEASEEEAQLIETTILNIQNHQSLIATKASRVVRAADGDAVLEFGLRRAQGPDAGIYGARAAIIGGCVATSNVLAGKMFNVPVKGTHAHAWVMNFDTELEAFRAYAEIFPDNLLFLVDTYDTLRSGVPNAIKVFQELKDKGNTPKLMGIRLDSGDLATLSKEARRMLDNAGFHNAIISASNDLDEGTIQSLKMQGAKITLWGVGTKLITAYDDAALGGVYKLAAVIENGEVKNKMKFSDNIEKITNPGRKNVLRIYDKYTGMAKVDLIIFEEEEIDEKQDLKLYDETHTWKNMTLKGGTYVVRRMLIPIFKNGKCVYESPSVMNIQKYCSQELKTLWDEYKRLHNPDTMKIDISDKLYDLKKEMIMKNR